MLQFLEELETAALREDFYATNEVIEKIKKEKDPMEYLDPMFRLLESNPDVDFGIPGPIVHFMETYYKKGYEKLLLESINRCPTNQTIWMTNRIINDPTLIEKRKYLEVLESLLNRDDLPINTLLEIKKFLDFQNNK